MPYHMAAAVALPSGALSRNHVKAPSPRGHKAAAMLRHTSALRVAVPLPRQPTEWGGRRPRVEVNASSRPGSHRPEDNPVVDASFSEGNGAAPPPHMSDPNRGTDTKSVFLWLGAAYAMATAMAFGFFPSAMWAIIAGKQAVLADGCRAACVMLSPCLLGWGAGMMSAVDAGPKASAEYCQYNALSFLLGANLMNQMESTVLAWCFALASLASYAVSFTGRKVPRVPRVVTPCGWKASAFMAVTSVFLMCAVVGLYLSPQLGWQVLMGPGAAFPNSAALVSLMSVPCLGWAISQYVAFKAGEEAVSSLSEIVLLAISFALYFGVGYGVKWYTLPLYSALAVGYTYFGFFGDGCHSVNKIKSSKPEPEETSSIRP